MVQGTRCKAIDMPAGTRPTSAAAHLRLPFSTPSCTSRSSSTVAEKSTMAA